MAACWSGQLLRSRFILPAADVQRAAATRRRRLAVAAGRKGAGGGGAAWRRREAAELLLPGFPQPLRFIHLTQRDLTSILNVTGAIGFETAGGRSISVSLQDLPEGGAVRLVLPPEPMLAKQRVYDGRRTARESLELRAYLRILAITDNPRDTVTALPTRPFQDASGQDCIKLDAAVVAGSTLYLGEYKRVLGELSIEDLESKLRKIRVAKATGCAPELATALQGVTHAKLFLAGQGVHAGLTAQQFADLAGAAAISLVLPSGQGLAARGTASAIEL